MEAKCWSQKSTGLSKTEVLTSSPLVPTLTGITKNVHCAGQGGEGRQGKGGEDRGRIRKEKRFTLCILRRFCTPCCA